MMAKSKRTRAFTVVELLIAMTIMGIVLALAVVEFAMVFNHNSLLNSNLTADQNARIVMAKVANEIRQAMPDVTDFQQPPYPLVVTPTAPPPSTAPAPAQSITFYRVHNGTGGLTPPSTVPIPTNQFGAPTPCYDTVTLTFDPVNKKVTKTVSLVTNSICTVASSTTSDLAYNVTNFSVTANSKTLFTVDVETTPSKGGYGVYDLSTQIALGYKP